MRALFARLRNDKADHGDCADDRIVLPQPCGGPDLAPPQSTAPPAALDAQESQDNAALVARKAAQLGFAIVDVSGFLAELDTRSAQQKFRLDSTLDLTEQVMQANIAVDDGISRISQAVQQTLDTSQDAVGSVRISVAMSRELASWVSSVGTRIDEISSALKGMEARTTLIEEIALQVYMLSINARIEATRAGDAGRGFAVIAKTVKDLSDQTNVTTDEIRRSVKSLGQSVQALSQEVAMASQNAEKVTSDSLETDVKLTQITQNVTELSGIAATIRDHSALMRRANDDFDTSVRKFGATVALTAQDLNTSVNRVDTLIDISETLVQLTAGHCAASDDRPFIDRVMQDAAQMGLLLEQALAQGRMTEAQLFSRNYTPLQGTNPQQYNAPFCKDTDHLFTPLQEDALALSDAVVFCAAVNVDGFLPTHNRKFSHRPKGDPVWDAANCRNRRLFNDRVGLKAGQNTGPFLLQVYRRDMGNGAWVMMKDVSAPIMVNGRHWGGLRLAYTV